MKQRVLAIIIFFALMVLIPFLRSDLMPAPASAQDSPGIDDVIKGLDRDFSFGGKEEVKRDNIRDANETNREDIKIRETSPTTTSTSTSSTPASPAVTSVQFSIAELNIGAGDNLLVTITNGGTLASGLDDATVTPTVSLPPGTNQTLSVTCIAALSISCTYDITILTSGILFGAPILSNTTGVKVLGIGLTDNFVLPIP